MLSALAAQSAPVLGPPPLLGNVSGVTDTRPQIAYDHGTDRYCVVWNAYNGTAPGQIHAQMLNGSGNPVGQLIVVSTNARLTRPAIAKIRTTGKFLIGWTEETGSGFNYTLQVRARSRDASNAALSTSVVVESLVSGQGPSIGLNIDIVGNSRNGFLGSAESALVAWQEVRQGSTSLQNSKAVRCRTVWVPSTGAPVLGVLSPLSTSGGGAPRVTRHCGVTGRWGVVWSSHIGQRATFPHEPLGVHRRCIGSLCDADVGDREHAGARGGCSWIASSLSSTHRWLCRSPRSMLTVRRGTSLPGWSAESNPHSPHPSSLR